MNMMRLSSLTGLLIVAACVSGCKENRGVTFGADDTSEYSAQMTEPALTTLVSSPVAPETAQPTLTTLPRGGDLNAQITNFQGAVLLDFYADWCGPCRMQGKILHDVEGTAAKTKTQIIKINVDDHPHLAQQLQVQSLPTLMMIKNGRIVVRQSGVANADQLVAWMQ